MTENLSTKSLQSMLTFPFKDPNLAGKFFTGIGLILASCMVPLIPGLFVNGYIYRIMHNVIVEKEDPTMPEWTDWSKLLSDGWRMYAVTFLYQLPMAITWVIGTVTYMISFIGIMASENSGANQPDIFLTFIPLGVFMIAIFVATLLAIVTFTVMPAAVCHTVAKDSFSAGFDFTGWWKVMKANIGGFAVALLVLFGMLSVMYLVANIFYMTIVLMCLMFVIPVLGMYYIELVGAALIGVAYREGVERVNPALVIVEAAPAVIVEETPKTKTRRAKKVE